MRSLHTADGELELYTDNLGAPIMLINEFFAPLVTHKSKRASKIRVDDRYALASEPFFNFKRAVVAPEWINGQLVFKRLNGDVVYTLKGAGY